MISGIKHKGIMAAICVLAAIALFAGLGGSTRDNLLALTVGTEHGNAHHDILLVKRTSSWHTSGSKSTSETLSDFARSCQTPMLVMPDDTAGHPYQVSMDIA